MFNQVLSLSNTMLQYEPNLSWRISMLTLFLLVFFLPFASRQGNAAFKEKQWQKAVNFYTEAIKLNGKVATYYSNRAAAFLELTRYDFSLSSIFFSSKILMV